MTSRAVRYLLLTLFVGSFAAAAYVTWDEERRGQALAAAARAFDEEAVSASRLLLDLRHAQSGYVAAGQGDEFWTGRADALFGSAREALSRLQGLAQETSSRTVAEAGAAFDDFQQMDRRARSYVRNGQRLLASDLVFSDGLERIELAVAALDRARHAEREQADAGHREHRRAQLLAIGAAAGAGLLVAVLLLPLPRSRVTASPVAAAPRPAGELIGLRDSLPLQQKAVPAPVPATVAPSLPAAPTPAAPPPPPPAPQAVDLPGIAALCTELAQVADMQALPAALARAAALLRAPGIVLWICDPDGRELTPVLAHGYPAQLVARLGPIAREDENVTAAAFRTGLVQIVRPADGVNGAIAAPLVTPGGPVGVMAAEVSPDGGDGESTRAAASIVAAQLATLVGAPAARSAAGAGGA